MEKKSLVNSPVLFNEDGHTYSLEGHTLNGVTPIVAWLFPDTYKDIPQSVLDAAADYGSMVHKKCELYDSLGICEDEVGKQYAGLKKAIGKETLYNEYLVSDERRIASCIDVVFDDMSLADIKTTSKVHVPNVTMQLSIYAWLLEEQNPGVTAGELYCLWLPKERYGQPDVLHLQRVPSSICKQIVDLYFAGEKPIQAHALLAAIGFQFDGDKKTGEVTDEAESLMNELATVKKTLEQMTEREKELKTALMAMMHTKDIETWGNDNVQLTIKKAYERETVDSKKLKAEFPEAYTECRKITKCSESLTYKLI